MNLIRIGVVCCVICIASAATAQSPTDATDATPEAAETKVSFIADVAPILREHCLACHGPKKAEGGYRVDTYHELLKPGDSGADPLSKLDGVPHELLRRITTEDSYERMPAEADPLPADLIDIVRRWTEQGGTFDGADAKQDLLAVIPPSSFAAPPAEYPPVPVTALTFSPDGKFLVGGGYHELLVWNLENPGPPRRINNFDERILAFTWLHDQALLAVACGQPGHNGEVRLLDFAAGTVVATSGRLSDTVLDIALQPRSEVAIGTASENEPSPPAAYLAVAGADGTVRLLDSRDLTQKQMFASHADWVTAVAWSPDGKVLASASKDKSVKLYDLATGQLKVNYQGHVAGVRGVRFTGDAQHVISAGAERKLLRWKAENGEKVGEVGLPAEPFKIQSFDAALLIPCSNKNLIRIDTTNNSIAQTFVGHQDWVISSAVHQATGRYASGCINGEIRVWNGADGAVLHQWLCQPQSPQ